MLILGYFVRSTFYDSFGYEPLTKISKMNFKQKEFEALTYEVSLCKFVDYHNNYGSGSPMLIQGAVHFMSLEKIILLIENCVFCNCSGGGVYFSSQNSGSIVVTKTCAYKCHTSFNERSSGQFMYSASGPNMNNSLCFVSISQCSDTSSNYRYHSLYLLKGNQRFINSNSSKNYAYNYAALSFDSPNPLASSFSTIADNVPSHSICIYIHITVDNNDHYFLYCSFIRNTSPSDSGIFLITNEFERTGVKYLTFNNCIFQENLNTLIHNNKKGLDLTSAYVMENCFINHQYQLSIGFRKLQISSCVTASSNTDLYTFALFSPSFCDLFNIYNGDLVLPSPTECIFTDNSNLSIISNFVSSLVFLSSLYLFFE